MFFLIFRRKFIVPFIDALAYTEKKTVHTVTCKVPTPTDMCYRYNALIAIPRFARAGKKAIKNKINRQTEQKVKRWSKICCKEISSPTLKKEWHSI